MKRKIEKQQPVDLCRTVVMTRRKNWDGMLSLTKRDKESGKLIIYTACLRELWENIRLCKEQDEGKQSRYFLTGIRYLDKNGEEQTIHLVLDAKKKIFRGYGMEYEGSETQIFYTGKGEKKKKLLCLTPENIEQALDRIVAFIKKQEKNEKKYGRKRNLFTEEKKAVRILTFLLLRAAWEEELRADLEKIFQSEKKEEVAEHLIDEEIIAENTTSI